MGGRDCSLHVLRFRPKVAGGELMAMMYLFFFLDEDESFGWKDVLEMSMSLEAAEFHDQWHGTYLS